MELSSELISEIAGSCVIAPASHSTNERRKHERISLAARATVSPLSRGLEGMEEVVIVRDISVAGLGLLCSEAMEVGQEFVIQFSGNHGLAARILCKVAHCESGGFGGSQFIVGATFELVIHPAQPSAGMAMPSAAETSVLAFTADVTGDEKAAEAVAAPRRVRTTTNRLQALTQSWRRWLPSGTAVNDDATRIA